MQHFYPRHALLAIVCAILTSPACAQAQPQQGIDIDCDPAQAASATPAARLICDHALLSMGYRRIFADQQRLLREQKISDADIASFRKQRDACTSLDCLDATFSAWKQKAAAIKARKP